MSAIYREGEIVRATVEGPVEQAVLGAVYVGGIEIPLDAPGLTIDRVAPAEWPPQPGDLWRTERQPYFAVDYGNGDVAMVNLCGERLSPDFVLSHGRVTLVHRAGYAP